jgi:LysM repeat protein
MRLVSGRHAWLIPGLLTALLLATACFQPSGMSDILPTVTGAWGGEVSPLTPQPPTAIMPTEAVQPTLAAAPTQDIGGVAPFPTSELPAAVEGQPASTMNPLFGTATQIVVFATQTAAAGGGEPALTPTAGEQVEMPDTCTHVVQPGENLYRIALRYGLSVEAMAAANNITNSSLVHVGQQLTIPNCGQPAPPAPQPGARTHVVQGGENLYRIALRYGVTVQALAAANGITDPSEIYVGQVLTIP